MKAKKIDQIDLSEWTLDAVDELADARMALLEIAGKLDVSKVALKAAGEVLDLALKNDVEVSFPAEWDFGDEPCNGRHGPPPGDPMTIRIALPVGGWEDEPPEWECNLRDVVAQAIDSNRNLAGEDRKIVKDHRGMVAIRDGLRALAQMIDDALAK
jgi:hypothetical protein